MKKYIIGITVLLSTVNAWSQAEIQVTGIVLSSDLKPRPNIEFIML